MPTFVERMLWVCLEGSDGHYTLSRYVSQLLCLTAFAVNWTVTCPTLAVGHVFLCMDIPTINEMTIFAISAEFGYKRTRIGKYRLPGKVFLEKIYLGKIFLSKKMMNAELACFIN